jgi:hypothetical protein
MTTVKRILLFICIFLFGTISYVKAGNKKEIKGVLITVTYDTLEGFIKKTPDKKLFKSIKFRLNSDNEYVTLKPEQIEAFISDEFSLISHNISLNNIKRYIFIQKVYEGEFDLYYSWVENNRDVIDNNEDLYFAGFNDGKIIQMHQKYMIRTLRAIFKDCQTVIQQIDINKFDYYYYKYNKLLHFFSTYDECTNHEIVIAKKQKKIKRLNP